MMRVGWATTDARSSIVAAEIVTARLGDGGVPPESIQARKTEHSRSSRNRGLFARSAFFRGLSWSFAWEGLPLTRSHRVRLPRPGSRKTYDEMSRYGDSRRLAGAIRGTGAERAHSSRDGERDFRPLCRHDP